MAYTDEFSKEAYFDDLYELSIEEAAQKIHEGLWNQEQATVKEIEEALYAAIERKDLPTVKGSIFQVGSYNNNPAVLDAFEVAKWAESVGLELESNGAWNSYMHDEAELSLRLSDLLKSLRAQQRMGKTPEEILKDGSNQVDHLRDQLIELMVENSELRSKVDEIEEKVNGKPHPKAMNSLLKIIFAMAVKGYKYNPHEQKSDVPTEIAKDVKDVFKEEIEPDTVRKWLKESAKYFLI